MSWLATKYAWKCQNPLVKGGTRLVLLALALRVRKRRITTLPTSLGQLQALTLMSPEQIRRCLDTLEGSGVREVKRLNRGKLAVYGLPKMAGPLFVVGDDEEAVKMTDFRLPDRPRETGQHDRFSAVRMPGKNRAFRGIRAGGVFSSELVQVHQQATTTADERAVADLRAWLLAEFPKHNHGRALTISPAEVAGMLAAVLVAPRTLDTVKAMWLAMWTATTRDDPFFGQARDRGLKLFLHDPDRLERIASHRVDTASAAPTVWDALRARLEVKLTRHDFHTWIAPLAYVEDREGSLILRAPNDSFRDWLTKYFSGALDEAIADVRPGLVVVITVAAREALA